MRPGHNLAMETNLRTAAIRLSLDEQASVRLPDTAQDIALGFLRDPTEAACLMVGAPLGSPGIDSSVAGLRGYLDKLARTKRGNKPVARRRKPWIHNAKG